MAHESWKQSGRWPHIQWDKLLGESRGQLGAAEGLVRSEYSYCGKDRLRWKNAESIQSSLTPTTSRSTPKRKHGKVQHNRYSVDEMTGHYQTFCAIIVRFYAIRICPVVVQLPVFPLCTLEVTR